MQANKTDIIRLAILLTIILGATLLPLFAGEVLLPGIAAQKEAAALNKTKEKRSGLFTGTGSGHAGHSWAGKTG